MTLMLDAEMDGLDVMLLVVNRGKFLPTAFVVAGNFLAGVVFGRIVPFPRNATDFPIVRVRGKRSRGIARRTYRI